MLDQSQILLENRIYSRVSANANYTTEIIRDKLPFFLKAIPETHLNSRCKMFQTRIFIWDYFGREIIVYDSKDGSVVCTSEGFQVFYLS